MRAEGRASVASLGGVIRPCRRWSFSRGIGTTQRIFAGRVRVLRQRRADSPRWLFERRPAFARACRTRRGDLGLGYSGRRHGDGFHHQRPAQHRTVFRRSIPHADALPMATRRRQFRSQELRTCVDPDHSGTFAIRPCGPLGVITVRLRPEGAARLARASMRELMNVKIGLGNIFRSHDISLLEEQVMEARAAASASPASKAFCFGAWGRTARIRCSPALPGGALQSGPAHPETRLAFGYQRAAIVPRFSRDLWRQPEAICAAGPN